MKKSGFKKFFMKKTKDKKKGEICCGNQQACGGGIYFLGFLGSAVYYIQEATTFGQGVVGFLKALVWPAFLVHKLFGFNFISS